MLLHFAKRMTIVAFCFAMPISTIAKEVTIAVWGDGYGQKYENSVVSQWKSKTSHDVTIVRRNRHHPFDEIVASKEPVDVISLSESEVRQGCADGLLKPISTDIIDNLEDFGPGLLIKCGVPYAGHGYFIVYSKNTSTTPSTLGDFLDLNRMSGKRGLYKSPYLALEMALLTNGVSAGDIYDTMVSSDGVMNAFDKLKDINDRIVWWHSSTESIDALLSGHVSMTAMRTETYNTYFWEYGSDDLGAILEKSLIEYDYLAVPNSTKNEALAFEYIGYATSTEGMKEFNKGFFKKYLLPRSPLATPVDDFGRSLACPSGTCSCPGGGCRKNCCSSSIIPMNPFEINNQFWHDNWKKISDIQSTRW